jgi:hypothetical protein
MLEDAKAFSFAFTLAPNSARTFYIRGAKTNSAELAYALNVIVIGVKN